VNAACADVVKKNPAKFAQYSREAVEAAAKSEGPSATV